MDTGDTLQSATEYVELEADCNVLDASISETFEHFGSEIAILEVLTDADPISEFWVAAGDTIINLYPREQFENPDYVFSFHLGISSRIADKQVQNMDKPPEGEKYDAFISHASEDKEDLVEPLVRELKRKGHMIWYDRDELEIGDNIRTSINKGLSEAHTGIVVVSDSFFSKSWPQRELDGLITRGIDSDTSIILPVWYKMRKEDVMEHSPPLANKKAIKTNGDDIDRVADLLSNAIKSKMSESLG